MECFCKGVLVGMIAGVCVGAIIVARNKKLANKLNQGLDVAEDKIKDIKEDLEDKLSQNSASDNGYCYCGTSNESTNYKPEQEANLPKNNFSKKNKND